MIYFDGQEINTNLSIGQCTDTKHVRMEHSQTGLVALHRRSLELHRTQIAGSDGAPSFAALLRGQPLLHVPLRNQFETMGWR